MLIASRIILTLLKNVFLDKLPSHMTDSGSMGPLQTLLVVTNSKPVT